MACTHEASNPSVMVISPLVHREVPGSKPLARFFIVVSVRPEVFLEPGCKLGWCVVFWSYGLA